MPYWMAMLWVYRCGKMWVKQCHKPPMKGNGKHTTYKNCDLGDCFFNWFTHITPSSDTRIMLPLRWWRTYHRHRRTIRSFPWPEVNRSSQVHPLCGKDFSSWRDLLRHGMGSGEVLCGRGPSPVGRSYWLWKVDVREWSNRRRSLQELRRGFKWFWTNSVRWPNTSGWWIGPHWSPLVPIGPHWSPFARGWAIGMSKT